MGIDLLDLLMRGKPVPIQPMLYLPLSIYLSLPASIYAVGGDIHLDELHMDIGLGLVQGQRLCSLRYRNERRRNTCAGRKSTEKNKWKYWNTISGNISLCRNTTFCNKHAQDFL